MPTPARVVVLPQQPGPLQIVSLDLPDPGPYQVVVKQYASGVCHSQLHQMHNPRANPVVLGHESTGIVLQVGSAVEHVAAGDMVMVTWVPRNANGTDRAPESATLALPDGSVARSQNVFTWADTTIADEQYVVKVANDTKRDVTAIIGCAVMSAAWAYRPLSQLRPLAPIQSLQSTWTIRSWPLLDSLAQPMPLMRVRATPSSRLRP